ncbi:hypothetical protein [Maribacter sp. 2304DJ31-5]|uniref:hypothetical protein n=1 Tax=Maribacter sp. 2304DJ31-5 TaxID=3386273 RepID=UPI0039BD32F5
MHIPFNFPIISSNVVSPGWKAFGNSSVIGTVEALNSQGSPDISFLPWSDMGRMGIWGNDNVGIPALGINKLTVSGHVHTKEVRVDLNGWPDYVSKEGYDLPILEEVEKHIKEKSHLPNIPSAREVEENGILNWAK